MATSGLLAVLIVLCTPFTDTSSFVPSYLGCLDYITFYRDINFVNPGVYSPNYITEEICSEVCFQEAYSYFGLREHKKLCFCGRLGNGTEYSSLCDSQCLSTTKLVCEEETRRISVYQTAEYASPTVWIQELEPGVGVYSSDKPIFGGVVFPKGYFPPWEKLTFTVGMNSSLLHEPVMYEIDFGDGYYDNTFDEPAFYHEYLSTGKYEVVISVLSLDKVTIASKSYNLTISLPLEIFGQNVVTVDCPKEVTENDTLSCQANVPSGTGLSAVVNFGSEVEVESFSLSDTRSSYIGVSWDSNTVFSDVSGENVPTEYMKIWEPVEDTRALLVACDVEITQPGNVNFVVRKKVEVEDEVDDCQIVEESGTLDGEDDKREANGTIQCVEPERYSFAKRACVPVSSARISQLEPSLEKLTYPHTFTSSGTHRVFFNEPIWLKKGDILGVEIFESAIAKVAEIETPDCVLPSGSTTCSYSGVEACVGFITLRSSRVMVQKMQPPSLNQQTLNTVWSFQSDLDFAVAEDTLEFVQPITNVIITGQEMVIVAEPFTYQLTFDGKADVIIWSFGDGEEMKTSRCELNITKKWWRVGDFDLTVTVSNKASSVKFILPVRVGLFPHIIFKDWHSVVTRGELAFMEFFNGYIDKQGQIPSSEYDRIATCYVSTSVEGSDIIDMKSIDDNVWVPATSDKGQYIKFFYKESIYLSAVSTKGHPDRDDWVEEFKMFYHIKGGDWFPLLQLNGSDIFYGNFDQDTVVQNTFATIYTDAIKLEPTKWHNNIALRWEVAGEYQFGIFDELFLSSKDLGLTVSDGDPDAFLDEYAFYFGTSRNISFSKSGHRGNVSCYSNEPGNYWFQITASNDWGEVTAGTNLYVQDPIVASKSMLSKHVFSASENVTLNLTLDSGDFVEVNMVILDGEEISSSCENWMEESRQLLCFFRPGMELRAIANHTVLVELKNHISGIVTLEESFLVIEEVEGLTLMVSNENVDIGQVVVFSYELLRGTNVTVTVSVLNDTLEFYHACASCGPTAHTFDVQFTTTAEAHFITIRAENFLNTITDVVKVHVVGNVGSVMLSYDSLLEKKPLENAVATLNFTFGGTGSEIPREVKIECDFIGGPSTLNSTQPVFDPEYQMLVYFAEVGRKEMTCEIENPTSTKTFHGIMEVEEPISGLIVIIDALNITMLESVFINASVETGSRVHYAVSFGDGDSVSFDPANPPINVEHVYRQWGTFLVEVVARNELAISEPVIQSVIVSTPSEGCVLFTDNFYLPLPAGNDHMSFLIDLFVPRNLPVPNLAEYNLYVNDSLFVGGFLNAPASDSKDTETLKWVTFFEVQGTATGLAHLVVHIEKSSEHYSQTCFWDVFIVEEVSGITSQIFYAPNTQVGSDAVGNSSWLAAHINPFGNRPVIEISSPVRIEISTSFGSSLSFVWSYELMESEESTCEAGKEAEGRVCEFLFHNDRDFTFSINVTNPVSTTSLEQEISIFKPVGSVSIEGPTFVVRVYKNIPFRIIVDRLGSESCYQFLIKSSFVDMEVEAYYGDPSVCELSFPDKTSGSQTVDDLDGFTKTIDESGTTFAFVHNFTVPSTYVLQVIGKNLLSQTEIIYHQAVLEPACYKPFVDVASENQCVGNSNCNQENTTKLFAASDVVTVLSRVRLNCSSSYLAVYNWKVFLVSDDAAEVEYTFPENVVTSGYTLGTLTIPSATLRYGFYRVELNVTMEGAEDATNGDSTYIEIDSSPLVAKIAGGDYRTIPWGSISILDGLTYSFDPDVGREDKSGLIFHWLCRRKTYHPEDGPAIENIETFETWSFDFSRKLSEGTVNPEFTSLTEADVGGCFGRYGDENAPLPGGLLNNSDGIMEWDTSSMFENMEYEIKLIVRNDFFQAEFYQTWHVLLSDIPSVAIACLENCGKAVNPTNRLALQSFLDVHSEFIPYFKWELYLHFPDRSEITPETYWGNFSTTGSSSPAVTFLPGIFKEGENYNIVMYSSWSIDFHRKAIATYQIVINSPPRHGTCDITAYEGTALLDQFSVFCFGWDDIDFPLTYTFRARAVGTLDWNVFHSSTKAYMEPTTFQPGLEEFDFNVEIQISVHDKLGSSTNYDLIIIKVTPGPSPDSEEAAEVVESLTNKLVENAANGETSVAANIAINIIEVLNNKSALETDAALNADSGSTDAENIPGTEVDGPLDIMTRISIRTEVVKWLAETENPTAEAIDQKATALAQATKIPQEVSEEAQEKVVNVALEYSSTLLQLANEESTVDDSLKTATNRVLQLANNVVSSAMLKLNITTVTIEEATSVDIYEEDFNEALIEPEEKNKDILEEAETSKSRANADIKRALSVVEDIQNIIEQNLVPDEAPSQVAAEGITVTCAKTRPLSNETSGLMTQINENCSVTLPQIDLLKQDGFTVSPATVWVLETALFNFNIKPEDEVANMNGQSLSVKMRDFQSGEELTMKNLSDSFRLSIPQREESIKLNNETMQTYSNESNPKGAAIAVHSLYVPWSNALTVEFEAGAFEEMELNVVYNFTFHILLKQKDAPSFYDFDLECLLQQQFWLTKEPPKNRKRTHKFKVATRGEKACFFDNDDLDFLRDGNRSAVNFHVGVSHTFVANLSPQETDKATKLDLTSILYKLRPHLSKCYFASESGKSWKSVGCKVLPTSTISQTDCACNHLTLFGGGFQVPINKIDLSDSAFTKLDENPVVFTFLLACLSVYAIIIVWARKKDMRDLEKTGVTPLPDNDPRDKFLYEVTVYTGFKANAGTTAKVSFNIAGDKAETGPRPFLDPKRKVFQQGGIDSFLLASSEALGELQFLRVWHDNSGNDASWFLSRVSVKDLKTEKMYYFIVDEWLAVEEDDGKIERVCPVAGKSELTAFGFLFYSKSRKNLSDGHLWFSIFARPYKSNFTRVQRATCCLSLLFSTMMANIFFYNVEFVNGNQTELFKLGPVTLTVGEVIIGCISSLMVFPVNLIVVNIFRSVKPPPKNHGIFRWIKRKLRKKRVTNLFSKEDPMSTTRPVSAASVTAWITDSKLAEQELERERDILEGAVKAPVFSISGRLNDPNSEDVLGGDHRLEYEPVAGFKRSGRKKKKKRFLLPWYFVYLGWFLVIATVFASFFLTVEVAGQFGKEKSTEWLLSIGVSLVQDIFLAQPIKVLLLAIFFSLIVKKPEEEDLSNDELTISQLRDDEEYMHERMTLEELNNPSKLAHLSDIKRKRITMTELPTFDDLEQSRTMRLKEIKMRKVLMEIIFYIIFLNVIIIISFGDRDFNSFWINRSMHNMFVDAKYHGRMKFTMVKNRTGFWNWTDHTLIPSLYSLSWYNGHPDLPGRDQHQVADQTMSLIGTPRFRQLRILKDYCSVPVEMRKNVDECKDEYSIAGNDAGIYNESWEHPLTDTSNLNLKSYPKSVWAYQDLISSKSIPYPGYHGLYAGGGYIAELGKTPRESWRVTRYLKEKKWVDQYTRAVFIEFVVYNPSVNLFCASFLIMEFPPQGGAAGYVYFIPMKLDRYHSSAAYIILTGEVVYVCFILYFMVREVNNIRREKAAYFKSMWNILEIVTIVLAVLGLICYIGQLLISRDLLTQYREQPKKFLNFQYVSTWAEFNIWCLSGVLFIATLKFLRLLRFNRRLQLLALTFRGSGKEIVAYTVVFGIVFMAYASAAYLLFSVGLADFSTFVRTVESLFATIMGKFNFQEMRTYQRFFGPVFFFTFVMLMIFILMSMFLSIINAAFRKVRINNEMEENELEMVNFIMSRFLRWTGFSQRRMRNKGRTKSRYIEGVDSVAEECDEMKVKLNEMIIRLQRFVVQERREQFGPRGDEGKARRIFFT